MAKKEKIDQGNDDELETPISSFNITACTQEEMEEKAKAIENRKPNVMSPEKAYEVIQTLNRIGFYEGQGHADFVHCCYNALIRIVDSSTLQNYNAFLADEIRKTWHDFQTTQRLLGQS